MRVIVAIAVFLSVVGCAAPECPMCPSEDMAIILPGLPFVLKMPKGGMSDEQRAIPFDKFEEIQKRNMMRHGRAL